MALLLESIHSTNRLLNRRHRVRSMHIIQINIISPQPLETLPTRLQHILGIRTGVPTTHIAKFRGKEDMLPLLRVEAEPFSQQILAVPIDVRSISESLPGSVELV